MKRYKLILLCIAAALVLCACKDCTQPYEQGQDTVETSTAEDKSEDNDTATKSGSLIKVYVSDNNAERFIATEVSVEEVNENTVFDALKAAGTIPKETELLTFTKDGRALKIDLSGEFSEKLCTMGTSGEYMLMGSLVNTYLEAMDADTVFILSQGKVIETGHSIYDMPLGRYSDNIGQ